MSYSVEERGRLNTPSYRLFFKDAGGRYVSPFHDIPLYPDGEKEEVFNMVVEVPRGTNAKMEMATREPLNPIRQDVAKKSGALRYVANVFPHQGYIWNYGALPQTWEDPGHRDEHTGCRGDDDPLDVCEIGSKMRSRGEVVRVKVLGVLAMIDEDETDWKVLAVGVDDPEAQELNGVDDVRRLRPDLLEKTVDWFRRYKLPDGKPENRFALNGQFQDREFAVETIRKAHGFWRTLVESGGGGGGLSCKNTGVSPGSSPHHCSQDEAKAVVERTSPHGPEETQPPAVNYNPGSGKVTSPCVGNNHPHMVTVTSPCGGDVTVTL